MLFDTYVSVVLAHKAWSTSSQILFWSWVVVIVMGGIVMHLFRRRQGGIDPKTGKPGGAEPEIVAVLWFLAALAGALYITYSTGEIYPPSAAVG